MEDLRCIFCNQGIEQIVIEENGFKGRKCSQCGLIFISPRLTFSETLNLYVKDQGLTSAKMHQSDAHVKRLHAKHNINIIKKYKKKGTILEIGSGAGYFLDEAKKEGYKAFGIEPNKIAADFVNNTLNIPCVETSLSETTFGEKKFDIIYHCNVLSHFYDPILEFNKISKKLKDEGIVVFETGNIGEIQQKYYSLFDTFGYPDHLFFFGEDSVRSLLKITEFELMKIYRYSILWYLMTQKVKQRIKDFIMIGTTINRSSNSSEGKIIDSDGNVSGIKNTFKSVYKTMLYIIRYKVGYMSAKGRRPQTIIVIARKRKRFV